MFLKRVKLNSKAVSIEGRNGRVADGVEEDAGRAENREKGRIVGEVWLGWARGGFMEVQLPSSPTLHVGKG